MQNIVQTLFFLNEGRVFYTIKIAINVEDYVYQVMSLIIIKYGTKLPSNLIHTYKYNSRGIHIPVTNQHSHLHSRQMESEAKLEPGHTWGVGMRVRGLSNS